MVIGHHAHVVRGVEMHKGKVIFYGLGNFLIRGARDMRSQAKLRVVRDYGLLGRVHFKLVDGKVRPPSKFLHFEGENVVGFTCKINAFSETGVCGDATKASKEKGVRLWEAAIKNTAELIEELKLMEWKDKMGDRG